MEATRFDQFGRSLAVRRNRRDAIRLATGGIASLAVAPNVHQQVIRAQETCTDFYQLCSSSEECCGEGVCHNGICDFANCIDLGAACTENEVCCGGGSCAPDGTCGFLDGGQASDVDGNESCSELGNECFDDVDCCDHLACTTAGSCGHRDGGEIGEAVTLPTTGIGEPDDPGRNALIVAAASMMLLASRSFLNFRFGLGRLQAFRHGDSDSIENS